MVKPYHDTSLTNLGGPHALVNSVADVSGGTMSGFIKEAEITQPQACHVAGSCAPPDAMLPKDSSYAITNM